MSEFVLNEASDNGFQDGFINGVTFLYVCIQDAKTKWKSEELEYSVKCVVDKATGKAFKKTYPKNGVKEVDNEEFESTYSIGLPFPNQEEQYIITLKTSATDKNGALLQHGAFKRPKVYVPNGKGGVKDITRETLIANGSKGDVNFWVSTSEFGQFPKLAAILVSDLIPYEKKASAGSAWGAVEGGEEEYGDSAPDNGFARQSKEDAPEEISDESF